MDIGLVEEAHCGWMDSSRLATEARWVVENTKEE